MLENNAAHNIILENRRKVLLTGVGDVLTFSEEGIVAETSLGQVTLHGSEIKINGFNADKGELSAEGNIAAIVYTGSSKKESLFTRLFK